MNTHPIKQLFAAFFLVAMQVIPTAILAQKDESNLQYLKPEIGGVGRLLVPTRPTIQLPYQMIRMTPDRDNYLDDQIRSFPLQLVSHRLGQVFPIKPSTAQVVTKESWEEKLAYDQDLEIRNPWHYHNFLTEKNIEMDFVPGRKTAIFRFTFPNNTPKHILFGTYNQLQDSWKLNTDGSLQGIQLFPAEEGKQPVKVYFYGRFNDKPAFFTADNKPLQAGIQISGNGKSIYATFPSSSTSPVTLRYAVSYISAEQARQNLIDEQSDMPSLDAFAGKGKAEWAKVMEQIQVEGGTIEQKESFYTALYRCYERMVNISEDGKYYSGYDNKVHKDKRDFYVDDWAWDTYLALHPLRTILQPTIEQDMLESYVRMYQQSGWMPTFPVLYGDHACMNGFHSSVSFLDAWNKGLKNFNVQQAYAGMRKNAASATMLPWKNGPATKLDSFYYAHGYLPALHPGEKEPYSFVHSFERRQAVAVTLGTSYDDWAVAQLAKGLNKENDYRYFTKRSFNYRNLWNADRQFFLPKDSAGNWINIDPKFDGGPGGRDYYDENNGWTYMWQVQHNIPDLIQLMGGKAGFEKRLDQLFREGLGREKKLFWVKFTDATGLIGQFSMGNEPSFFIPYLYNYTGSPWKTQEKIRILLSTWFHNDIFGIPGDEDGGGMSAFVVFSSMGFYPITPGTPVYTIGSPLFTKTTIHLENGKDFTVVAPGASKQNKYIQAATLNGKPLNTPFITHQDIISGGTLKLIMGDRPNKEWGVSK
ncbi:GH92 family glycosyl hydrolase [Arachidicoccus terrestris]|uniref:GH92 family glycosyl hydrolase n=1 Tax=Arachidicoccus terrestris TaxID=2875539 RepID=UPI001CC4D751|nr:GH92 family glycosyl hydrolase [Arachidicoccus terrestris]UAY53961.1 GH92 family glycosyl hydrolase [Arachidicoccus terrestris]